VGVTGKIFRVMANEIDKAWLRKAPGQGEKLDMGGGPIGYRKKTTTKKVADRRTGFTV